MISFYRYLVDMHVPSQVRLYNDSPTDDTNGHIDFITASSVSDT